jgi:zinc/manganese transport system substrate-binding protein
MYCLKLAILLFALVMPGAAAPAHAAEKLKAIATFSILGDMVAKVGEDRVSVKTLVGSNGNAHVYEPTPGDAAELAAAAVIFENGLNFEGWVSRLIAASGYHGPVIQAAKGIKVLTASGPHGEAATDPHAWQSPFNALVYVSNIRDGLCEADPEGCDTYTRSASAYSADIRRLGEDIQRRAAAIPKQERKVITSHDAFGYFGAAFDIEFLAPLGVSAESEASGKDVARLIGQIRRQQIKALFGENISDPRLIDQISRETGVQPAGRLYSDALSQPSGPAASYIEMMRYNSDLILEAMTGAQAKR